MKFKLKIQQKIQFFIISASIVIYVIAIGYISFSNQKEALNNATHITDKVVENYAKDISKQLNSDMSVVKTLSYSYLVYESLPLPQWKTLFKDMYLEVFNKNPHFYSLWDSWELNALDPTWEKTHGRYSMVINRDLNGKILTDSSYRSMDKESQIYDKIIKLRRIPSIWEPYFDNYVVGDNDRSLMTTLNSPIIKDGQYVGIVAIDITLDNFQQMVKEIKPFEGSYAFMVSNGGIIAGHPNQEILNQRFEDLFPDDQDNHKILEKIKDGEAYSYTSKNNEGIKLYYSFTPIVVSETNTPWSIAIVVPVSSIMATANRNFRISLFVGVFGIIILGILIIFIGKSITNPLTKITGLLKLLSHGHVDDKMKIKIETGDEIEEISDALNSSIEGLNKKVDFANHIGKGELTYNFELLSDEDALGKSLIEMRDSLAKADEEDQKRNIEDEKRRWTNEGLAKFGDILRQNNDNLENLATEIIISLVGYLEANQGGVFVLNDDDSNNVHFNLLAAYAYDRRKFLERNIELGEGLVGNCAIEKETIFMTEVPQDYVEITSGLGGANPNCLLIVPLKIEETVLGVIEIASFKVFDDFEIEFVEKLAESIASTLSSVKVNIRTTELLERSQQQAEEMTAQEEEMRQNMEELQATQEEMRRKEDHLKGIIEEMKESESKLKKTIDKYKKTEIKHILH